MILKVLSLAPFLIAAIILLIAPVLTPQRIFFGVRVLPDFHSTEPAKRALRRYRWAVTAIALIGLPWPVLQPESTSALLIPPLVLFAVAIAYWLRNYRALVRCQVALPTVASVDLTTEPEQLPAYFWAATIPPIILAATAFYLHLHWSSIPARFPVHWGPDGQPNGWETRSSRGVYGPLLFAGLWMIWFIGMVFASWYGARRSPMRTAVAKIMIAVEYLFGVIWPLVSLMPLYGPPNVVLLVSLVFGGVAGVIAYSVVTFRNAGSASEEEAADANVCSSSRSSFFDRRSPAILLPRADGLGYCPNLAHPLAWILLLYPFLIVIIAVKFLF
jgi:uncharacterized membrane protein